MSALSTCEMILMNILMWFFFTFIICLFFFLISLVYQSYLSEEDVNILSGGRNDVEKTTEFMFDYLQSCGDRKEDGALQTKLVEINLQAAAQVARSILESPSKKTTDSENKPIIKNTLWHSLNGENNNNNVVSNRKEKNRPNINSTNTCRTNITNEMDHKLSQAKVADRSHPMFSKPISPRENKPGSFRSNSASDTTMNGTIESKQG